MFFDLASTPDRDKSALLAFELTTKVEAPAPVDPFELKLTVKPYTLMTDDELAAAAGSVMMFDVEAYENYTLVSFKHVDSGKVVVFEQCEGIEIDRRKLLWVMQAFLLVGFNCKYYDVPMVQLIIMGNSCSYLKGVSNFIIQNEAMPWETQKHLALPGHNFDYIDLMNVAPLKGGLKLYAARLNCERIQDLPFEHDKILTPEDIEVLKQYNIVGDLVNTEVVFNDLKPQLELRYDLRTLYGVDVRSRSDAQIAEAVIIAELTRIKGDKPPRPNVKPDTVFRYKVPEFLRYKTPVLQQMLEVVRNARLMIDEGSGSIGLPEEIEALKIEIGSCVYRMGIGGLHTSEKVTAHIADADTLLIDRDVVSYYPRIILNLGLFPKHLGKEFLTVYGRLVDGRVADKNTVARIEDELKVLRGNPDHLTNKEAKSLYLRLIDEQQRAEVGAATKKIIVNGSFGKLLSIYSALYAPDLGIQVTITGQLCLLLLIEMIEAAGIPVVSANTDGVLIKCPKSRQEDLQRIIQEWERLTGFETEEGRYKAVYSRDVNNYIAVKENGKVKTKGTYGDGISAIWKNPENQVCKDAVMALLTKGTAIEETIRKCNDVRRFLTVRNVTGGAVKSGVPLGRVVRWYFSTLCLGQIEYCKSGNKVPNTDGAMPLMELPAELPLDIDYDRYIRMAESMLVDIGHTEAPQKKQSRFLF